MVWGAMLDALGPLDVVLGPFSIDRYVIYFAALVVLACLNLRLVSGLHEGAPVVTLPPSAVDARPVAPVE